MSKNKLHPGAKWVFRIRSYLGFLFLGFFIGMWVFALLRGFDLLSDSILSYILFIVIFSIVFVIIFSEIYTRMAYNRWFYEIGHDDIRLERGIIWKRYSNIPYERIQNVDIYRGIIARMMGFSTIMIQTAGYSGYGRRGGGGAEGTIPAIGMKHAEEIREFVLKKVKGKKQGL